MKDDRYKINFIYTALYKTLLITAPLITAPYLSRVLGAEGIGVQSYCQALVNIFALFALSGTSTYGERQMAYCSDSRKQASEAFWNTKIFALSVSSVVLLLYFIFSVGREFCDIRFLFSLCIITNMIDCSWALHAFNDFGKVTLFHSFAKIADVIFIFLFVKNSGDLKVHIFGTLFFPLVATVASIPLLRKHIDFVPLSNLKPFKDTKEIISLFLPTIAMTLFEYLDKTMIGAIAGNSIESGFYEQASKIAKMSSTVICSIAIAVLPKVSYLWKNGTKQEISDIMHQSYRIVWVLGIPLSLGLIGISSNMVPWFFGDGFEKVILLIRILSFIAVPMGLSSLNGFVYLVATGKQKQLAVSYLTGFCVNFVLNYVLIRIDPSVGASVASIVSECCTVACQFHYIFKDIKKETVFSDSLKYIIAGFVMFFSLLAESFILDSSPVSTILMIVSGIIVYASCLVFMNDALVVSVIREFENRLVVNRDSR